MNNFIVPNHLHTEDDRFISIRKTIDYNFTSVEKDDIMTMDVLKRTENTTYDLITWEEETNTLLFGAYFYLSEKKIEHFRKAQNFLDVLSNFGGLSGAVFAVLSTIGLYLNSLLFMAHLISEMLAVKNSDPESEISLSI